MYEIVEIHIKHTRRTFKIGFLIIRSEQSKKLPKDVKYA